MAESRQNSDEILRVINREGNSKYRGHRKKTFGYDAGYIESHKRLEWIPNSESMYRESRKRRLSNIILSATDILKSIAILIHLQLIKCFEQQY